MRKLVTSGISLLFAVLMVVACSKKSEDQLTGNGGTGGTGGSGNTCDTVNMTYTANVLPIIKNNCYSCHGDGNTSGGVSLGDYASLKTRATNGDLIGTITHASGYPAMPEGGAKLSDCDINKIQDWINRGALNN